MTVKIAWSHPVFAEIFKQDPKEAFIYRERATGEPIPEEYRDNITDTVKEEESDIPDVTNVPEEIQITKAQVMEFLKGEGIKFNPAQNKAELMELAIENGFQML